MAEEPREVRKKEDELVQQTAELLAATRMDKGKKAEHMTVSLSGLVVAMRRKWPWSKTSLADFEKRKNITGANGDKDRRR